jgi:hypothetical protein
MPKIISSRQASDGCDVRVRLDSGEVVTYHMHGRKPESEKALQAEVEAWAAGLREPTDEPSEEAFAKGEREALVAELAATKASLAKAVADLAAAKQEVVKR